jgi:hypothetical protein
LTSRFRTPISVGELVPGPGPGEKESGASPELPRSGKRVRVPPSGTDGMTLAASGKSADENGGHRPKRPQVRRPARSRPLHNADELTQQPRGRAMRHTGMGLRPPPAGPPPLQDTTDDMEEADASRRRHPSDPSPRSQHGAHPSAPIAPPSRCASATAKP